MPDVTWVHLAAFVRQHTHDLRNELNGLDLEAALLADIVSDPEAAESVGRIRAEIRKLAANLRTLATKFAEPHPTFVRLAARELFLIWQDQQNGLQTAPEVSWRDGLADEHVNVDPGAVAIAFRELLANACSFGVGERLRAAARVQGDDVCFELREPKQQAIEPERWGHSPFVSTRRGGYGLGLCEVLRTVEASGGRIAWTFDAEAKELVTTIAFPAA
jgi:light-regulated signal transduction histidine kinase (bacteriophytochrome)